MQYVGAPRVVVLGGGFGGLYTALRLDELTWPDGANKPTVTLLDRSERFVFKPMLYELVNETMNDWEVAPTFEELLAPTGVAFHRGAVAGVEPNETMPMRGLTLYPTPQALYPTILHHYPRYSKP